MITGPFVKVVSSQEVGFSGKRTDMHLYGSRFYGGIDARSWIRSKRTKIDFLQIENGGRAHNAVYSFDLRLAQNKGSEFGQTINNAIILYGSMSPDCGERCQQMK